MRIPGATLGVLTLTLLACGGDNGGPSDEGTARIRVAHVSLDTPALDVAVDGETVADAMTYTQSTEYQSVPAGSVEVVVSLDVNGSELVQATPTLARDGDYTILVNGLLADAQVVVLTDDHTPPGEGFLKVRVIHSAPSAPPIDMHLVNVDAVPETPILQNIAFGSASPYVERAPPGDGSFVVTQAGTLVILLGAGPLEFNSGQIWTFILADAPEPGGAWPVTHIVFEDGVEAP
jgi:hypothetical protein